MARVKLGAGWGAEAYHTHTHTPFSLLMTEAGVQMGAGEQMGENTVQGLGNRWGTIKGRVARPIFGGC